MEELRKLTIKEAIEESGLSESTIRRAIDNNLVKAEKVKGKWVVDGFYLAQLKEQNFRNTKADSSDKVDQADKADQSQWFAMLQRELEKKDWTIEKLTEQMDHLTQLLAMEKKSSLALTELISTKDQFIEDMRSKPSSWQRFWATFGVRKKIASKSRS